MKRVLAVILCIALTLPFCALLCAAEPESGSAFADGENSLIVFVTGIGQSRTYQLDERVTGLELPTFDIYAPLIENGEYVTSWNLFNDMEARLKETNTLKAAAKVLFKLLLSVFTRKNMVEEPDADALVQELFKFNLLDENGRSAPGVVMPQYVMPVSDYPGHRGWNGEFISEAKNRFYSAIPCRAVCEAALGEQFEDYLYCFNYSPFSYTDDNVESLHSFIETALRNNKVGATQVVLVPMSMGASVVSAYLYAYPARKDSHVRRVVSIVGCWQGSAILPDIVTQSYADNSAELFYNGIVGDLVGEPWGYLVNILLRLFPKAALRGLIDVALRSISKNLIFTSPSLMALMPPENYPAVRDQITRRRVREQTDRYYDAQITLKERMEELKAQGVTFSFISGYGLPFGGASDSYEFFGFLNSAARTNSDEIINISSTAPGTECMPAGQRFEKTEGRALSPDGSLDIAKTWNKDASWFFFKQKHELEYNNTALHLAILLATGQIKTVNDCADPAGNLYFPQFNGARNVKTLTRTDLPAMEAYLQAGGTLTEAQQALYDEVKAMRARTVNDPDADDALMARFHQMCVELGLLPAEEAQENALAESFGLLLKDGNDRVNAAVGPRGFVDALLQPFSRKK